MLVLKKARVASHPEASSNKSCFLLISSSHHSDHPALSFSLVVNRWGANSYRLDHLVAAGNADSSEGLVFEELSLTSGPATCILRGSLLGARQEASLHVADFPLDLLAPLQQALPPALQACSL